MFTGDRSGQWLYRALFKAGIANQPESVNRYDGLELVDCVITAVCHCAPPDNKPTNEEVANCRPWLAQTIDLAQPRVFLALGQLAWKSLVAEARRRGWHTGKLPKFGHGAIAPLEGDRWLVGSYHPSQQNTFTGKLTEKMFDAVFAKVRESDHRLARSSTTGCAAWTRRLSGAIPTGRRSLSTATYTTSASVRLIVCRCSIGLDRHVHGDRRPPDPHHARPEADDVAHKNRLVELNPIHSDGHQCRRRPAAVLDHVMRPDYPGLIDKAEEHAAKDGADRIRIPRHHDHLDG